MSLFRVMQALGWVAVAALLPALPKAVAAEETAPPAPPAVSKEAPSPAPKTDVTELPEVDWWAVTQSFVEEQDAIVLSGSAWVRYKTLKLEADHIVYFRTTRELYAEGHVRLRHGESEVAAQVAYVDAASQRGYLVDATLRVSRESAKKPGRPSDLPPVRDATEAYAQAVGQGAAFLTRKDPYGLYLDTVDDPQARLNFIFTADRIIWGTEPEEPGVAAGAAGAPPREARHYWAENALLTNDDMAEPMYGIKVSKLDFYSIEGAGPERPARSYVKAKGARLKIGPVCLFPLPAITYDLTKHWPYMRSDWGRSSRWGPYSLFRIGWGLGGPESRVFDPARIYFDLDSRMARGPALGAEFRYKTGLRPEDPQARAAFERGEGHIRVYGLYEAFTDRDDDLDRAARNRARRQLAKIDGDPRRKYDANELFMARRALDGAGPASQHLEEYRDDWRWLVDFGHHQPLRHVGPLNDVQLDFKYQRQSDRDFIQEYFNPNYLEANQPEALASVRQAGDHYWGELLYRGNTQDFDGAPARSPLDYGTFTAYEPAFTYALTSYPLRWGLYLSGEAQVARLRREFEREIYDQSDFDAGRAYAQVSLQRPFSLLGVQFRPHLGGLASAYDDSRDGGGIWQGVLKYGVDVSKRLYGEFPEIANEELGISGLRHIIEPRLEYLAVSDPPHQAEEVLDFDAIDDLRGFQRVRLALDQIFQSGRRAPDGSMAVTDIAGLNISLDLYPREEDRRRLLSDAYSDLLNIEGFVRVRRGVSLAGGLGYAFSHSRVETGYVDLTLDPGGRWRLVVGERFNYRDQDRAILGSDYVFLRFELQLSERWGLVVEQGYQRRNALLDRKGVQSQTFTLNRRYGPLIGQISYHLNRNTREHAVNVGLAPAFAYRNLVVPMQDLLVEPSEVAEAEEAPEERNFDPFDLIKARRKKVRQGTPAPVTPPAPLSPGAPPNTGGGEPVPQPIQPADAIPLDVPPAASSPAPSGRPKPPQRVDSDDWGG